MTSRKIFRKAPHRLSPIVILRILSPLDLRRASDKDVCCGPFLLEESPMSCKHEESSLGFCVAYDSMRGRQFAIHELPAMQQSAGMNASVGSIACTAHDEMTGEDFEVLRLSRGVYKIPDLANLIVRCNDTNAL
jgi:hypothetical protein